YSKDECLEVPVSDRSIIDLTKSCDNTQGGRTDARQCKRERERARYAAMSVEKNELKNRRQSRKKENVVHHEYSKDDCPDVAIGDRSIINCTIPCGITLGYNWLGGCDDARQRKRERERARYATMSAEKKNELKRHRQSSKNENVVHHERSKESTSLCPVTAPHSDKTSEGADVGMQQQITPNVTTNDADEGVLFVENHDEDALFEDDDEEDGYLFAGQDIEIDETNLVGESIEDIEIDETQDAFTVTPDVPNPYDKIDLAPFETPPQLRRLWECSDADARHFRDNIRFFNSHLSFTSLYCCLDSMTTNMNCGIYTFRAHGMMYHNVSLEHRYRKCRQDQLEKDKAVTKQLVEILKGNPYSEHLRSMGHVDNIEDYHIALNLDQTLNQNLYNAPITWEVAAVWIERSERRGQFSNSVMLHGKDRSSHGICSYHGCYDALSYPMFFPKGELGWHANIPKSNVSMDEVDAYREQHRTRDANDDDTGIFNPVLHGKRLFQQFAVDTYIKIESSRLDFIRKNQDRLRANLYKGLVDSLHEGENRADKIGKRTMLSTSFIGGPRDMRRRYMDAMALVRKFGKPDIFLTMTRRDDGRKETVRGCELDNRWVVPYNPYLLRLFNCHINVEACGSIKAVKYLFKYIYKGHDHASVAMTDANKADGDVDEIKQYRDARWVTPPEALWRIFSFDLSQNSPPRMQLQLHLENMHMVSFHERAKVNHVVQRPGADRSMLTAYFEANRLHEEAGGILYRDFPEWYTLQQGKVWQWRNRNTGDRTVYGDTLPSFREAAQRSGLLEADDTIDECLNEAAIYQMPSALRRLFATILSMGKDIKTFTLPAIIDKYDESHGTDREIYEEESIKPTTEDVSMKETLNEEQRSAYDKILSIVDTNNGGVFFVDGPGGTGKTYLYKALLATLDSQDKIAVATATSGVAASILPGGRTAHSRFKIPLTIDDGVVCSFTKQSMTAKLLQKASLIIWDEASMTKRQAIEALDNSMHDIMGRPGLPFGGRTVVFEGDFRQVLPVVRKGLRAQIVAASLWSSYLWESMCHLKLVQNMRAQSDPWFAEYLLRVGGGTEEANNDGDVRLPDE
ncbi:hypothetical protein ACJX0J_042450, partial [Zea mays]